MERQRLGDQRGVARQRCGSQLGPGHQQTPRALGRPLHSPECVAARMAPTSSTSRSSAERSRRIAASTAASLAAPKGDACRSNARRSTSTPAVAMAARSVPRSAAGGQTWRRRNIELETACCSLSGLSSRDRHSAASQASTRDTNTHAQQRTQQVQQHFQARRLDGGGRRGVGGQRGHRAQLAHGELAVLQARAHQLPALALVAVCALRRGGRGRGAVESGVAESRCQIHSTAAGCYSPLKRSPTKHPNPPGRRCPAGRHAQSASGAPRRGRRRAGPRRRRARAR